MRKDFYLRVPKITYMKILLSFIFLLFLITGCGSNSAVNLSDPLASGRGFIEASLDGNYVKAEKYILPDSTNQQYLETLQNFNQNRSQEEREGYSNASIIVDSLVEENDTTTILYYYNSYKKEPSRIKVVKTGDEWLVDFKYSFEESPETQP